LLLTTHVEVRWNPNNIKHYKSHGYNFTYVGDTFTVPVEHLPPYQKEKNLKFRCDYCGEIFNRSNNDYIAIKNRSVIEQDSCEKCKGKKQKEITAAKQEKGMLTPEDNGYWTIPENRLKELDGYIKEKKTLRHLYSDKEGTKIWRAFKRANHSIFAAIEELGYVADSLSYRENEYTIPFHIHGYYNDFANVESAIKQFIADHNKKDSNYIYFPTAEDMIQTLHISNYAIQKTWWGHGYP